MAVAQEGERRDARAALFVGAEISKNLMGGLGMLGQHQLQVMAQRGFNRSDEFVWHADLVGERTKHMFGLLERGQ